MQMLQLLYGLLKCRDLNHSENPVSSITPLKAWIMAATSDERELLAQRVGTSVQYIGHLAVNDDKQYKREPKASLAAAIERETKARNKASKGRLPVVYRTDLNATCRGCEFARKCLGDEVVVRSEFPVVSNQVDLGP